MRIVISYAREDRPIVAELAETLTALGHETWTDAGAHSGVRWWDEILQRIQQCDVLLVVTSPASLVSKACTLERQYALRLRRQLLPVQVAPVDMQTLPSDFAQIQFFDFMVRNAAAAGRLHQALLQLPRAGPLPRPLPAPPAPPLSYLNEISDQIAALVPDVDSQHRIVTALASGLRSPDAEERRTAADLMQRYLSHPHRLSDPAERASQALGLAGNVAVAPAAGPYPPYQPQPPQKRSRTVTVLAWIGGAAVVLVVLAFWAASAAGGGDAVVAAPVVSQAVYNDLLAQGFQPFDVSCGELRAVVGATTYCSTTGLATTGTTVTVTEVSGGTVVRWVYS